MNWLHQNFWNLLYYIRTDGETYSCSVGGSNKVFVHLSHQKIIFQRWRTKTSQIIIETNHHHHHHHCHPVWDKAHASTPTFRCSTQLTYKTVRCNTGTMLTCSWVSDEISRPLINSTWSPSFSRGIHRSAGVLEATLDTITGRPWSAPPCTATTK